MQKTISLNSRAHYSDCYCSECETEILKDFACKGCGFDTLNNNEYYMVKNEIWLYVNNGRSEGMLCIGCVELRLGRRLTRKDFTDAPINGYEIFKYKSARLANRLKN